MMVFGAICKKPHIAITQHYKHCSVGGQLTFDYSQPTTQSIDLSPQAIADFEEEYKRRIELRHSSLSLMTVCCRWHITPSADSPLYQKVVKVIHDLRNREVARLMAQEGVSSEEATRRIAESYIEIGTHAESGRHFYRIAPCALTDIDRRLQRLFPERHPDGPAEGFSPPGR